jgi:cellulose synthase/poly-beta-1,6-N-acetylglucosamine synthase-like glycosyltransferase
LTAGTNFLTRSLAFEQAGWSPEYTLTEDYALGMELRKRKWKCRYVEEYLAVGEAPEQVRNCFQQRSRWAKVCASCGCFPLGYSVIICEECLFSIAAFRVAAKSSCSQ